MKHLLTSIILFLSFNLLAVTKQKASLVKSDKKEKIEAIAKKWKMDLSTKNGRSAFKKRLKKRRVKFDKLPLSEKKKILNKRMSSMRKRLKKEGLSEIEINKKIKLRQMKMKAYLQKFRSRK